MPRGVLVLKKEAPETHLEEQLGVSRHFNKVKRCFFEKVNNLDKLLASLMKKKSKKHKLPISEMK